MAFTVYPDQPTSSEIDPTQLKYHYYAQRGPVKGRLVPGLLHQGDPPAGKRWMDVTEVEVDLQERYFVQYTDSHTLVSGSLIQADRMPKGQWKEVKKRHTFWHRVLFNDPTSLTFFDTGGGVQVSSISSQDQFINDRVTPALAALYPNIPEYTVQGLLFKLPNSKKLHFNLYYFFGAFQDLGKDVSKLVPFDGAHSFFLANNVNVPVAGTNVEAWGITLNNVRGKSDGPNGAYCVVLEMLDVSPLGIEYVVLDNVITKNTIVFDPGGDL